MTSPDWPHCGVFMTPTRHHNGISSSILPTAFSTYEFYEGTENWDNCNAFKKRACAVSSFWEYIHKTFDLCICFVRVGQISVGQDDFWNGDRELTNIIQNALQPAEPITGTRLPVFSPHLFHFFSLLPKNLSALSCLEYYITLVIILIQQTVTLIKHRQDIGV